MNDPLVDLTAEPPYIEGSRPAVTVTVPGTCGELVQGWHPDWEQPVLVSCPIALYSRVTVQVRPDPAIHIPPGCGKARQAARLALDYLGRPGLGARVWLNSDLPPGRGMASSTADVVGVLAGLGLALGQPLAPAELARLACRVEPSDSTMFPGLAALAYRDSGQAEELGPVPRLPLLMLDPGLVVDTLAFNRSLNLVALRRLGDTTAAALDLLRQGVGSDDPAAIGAAATLSAISYQVIHHHPLLAQAQRWARATGALGVVRAHSGSVIGLLYPPGTSLAEPGAWLSARFAGVVRETEMGEERDG